MHWQIDNYTAQDVNNLSLAGLFHCIVIGKYKRKRNLFKKVVAVAIFEWNVKYRLLREQLVHGHYTASHRLLEPDYYSNELNMFEHYVLIWSASNLTGSSFKQNCTIKRNLFQYFVDSMFTWLGLLWCKWHSYYQSYWNEVLDFHWM